MNLDNMSREELFKVYEEASRRLGFYEMVTISLHDVKERLEEMQKKANEAQKNTKRK